MGERRPAARFTEGGGDVGGGLRPGICGWRDTLCHMMRCGELLQAIVVLQRLSSNASRRPLTGKHGAARWNAYAYSEGKVIYTFSVSCMAAD